MKQRPIGVTIICVFGLLGALLSVFGGVSALLPGSYLVMGNAAALGGLVVAISVITVILGLANFIGIYWLFHLLRKGWILTMVLELVDLVLSVVTWNYIGIVISGVIAIYLFTRKELFK
jgi:hypothetical protein